VPRRGRCRLPSLSQRCRALRFFPSPFLTRPSKHKIVSFSGCVRSPRQGPSAGVRGRASRLRALGPKLDGRRAERIEKSRWFSRLMSRGVSRTVRDPRLLQRGSRDTTILMLIGLNRHGMSCSGEGVPEVARTKKAGGRHASLRMKKGMGRDFSLGLLILQPSTRRLQVSAMSRRAPKTIPCEIIWNMPLAAPLVVKAKMPGTCGPILSEA
jgi:hypothetical protein